MSFERGNDPKRSMGIGMDAFFVNISKVEGSIYLNWVKGKRRLNEKYILRKRRLIPLKWVLPLLNKEKISIIELKLFFKISLFKGDFIENFGPYFFPWMFIKSRIRRVKKNRPYAKVDLGSYSEMETYSDIQSNSSFLNFTIISEDIEKLKSIYYSGEEEDKELRGVIYKGTTYEIKRGDKKIY